MQNPSITFIAQAGLPARELAHTLDSLVRVSRRVEKNHYVISPRTETTHPPHESRTHTMCKPNEYTEVAERTRVGQGTFTSPKTRYHVPNVIPACAQW